MLRLESQRLIAKRVNRGIRGNGDHEANDNTYQTSINTKPQVSEGDVLTKRINLNWHLSKEVDELVRALIAVGSERSGDLEETGGGWSEHF